MNSAGPEFASSRRGPHNWMARFSAALALLALLYGTMRIDSSYYIQSTGEFRAVQIGARWYAFDRGEHPEIDGLRFTSMKELPPRTSLRERMDRPITPVAPVEFTEVLGRLQVEHSTVELGRHTYIAWLELREPEMHIYGGRHWTPDGRRTPLGLTPHDMTPAFPEIGAYLERFYPDTDLGAVLRHGLDRQYSFNPSQSPILAIQIILVGAALWTLLSPLRHRHTSNAQPPASLGSQRSSSETP